MKRTLKLSQFYPHPPAAVWKAITDSRALARWLMENDFQPKVGHRCQFRTKPSPGFSGIVDCEVLEVQAPHRLRYTWTSGKNRPQDITWSIEAVPGGSRLNLVHSGFQGFGGILLSFMMSAGWRRKLPTTVAELVADADRGTGLFAAA